MRSIWCQGGERWHKFVNTFPPLSRFYAVYMGKTLTGGFANTTVTYLVTVLHPSLEGVHQGDVLGSWLHCMVTRPFIKELADIIGIEGFVKFFIDDGNMSGVYSRMRIALNHIFEAGPGIEYYVKRTKEVYLLGSCLSRRRAGASTKAGVN